MSSNRSPPLRIVVVGAGIAGLATAYTLRRAGHSVVILEKRDAKSMFGVGGICLAAANMNKLLYQWGVGPSLNEKGVKFDKIIFINGNCGDLVGSLTLREDLLRDLMPEMIIQNCDLIKILYDLAIREGVDIRQDANVIHADPDRVSVRLDTGETISGDIIVAADGYTSSFRSIGMGFPAETDLESGESVLFVAFTVERSLLEDDEGFESILEPGNWTLWMAEDAFLHIKLMNGGEYLGGSFSYKYNGPSKEGNEQWNSARDLESYGLDFTALEPRLRKILKLSKTVASRTFLRRPVSDDFVNDRSSIVLVGEAAYPFMFDASHVPALVIEDAETLGILFSRIRCREKMEQVLTAYEEIRYPRCESAYQHYQIVHKRLKCPIGPQQEARDAVLRQIFTCNKWENIHEVPFRSMWGDQLSIIGYDVNEAVDDWWAKIGKPVPNVIQVSVSNE